MMEKATGVFPGVHNDKAFYFSNPTPLEKVVACFDVLAHRG